MSEPIAVIRNYEELVDALRTRKNGLQLSNATVDRLAGLTDGHTDKILGPTATKGFSRMTVDLLLQVFAVKLVMVEDVEAAQVMAERWEQRNSSQFRAIPNRLSKALLERAKPLVFKDIQRSAGLKSRAGRMSKLSPKRRKQIAKKAIRTRWKRHRERKAAEAAASCQAHQAPTDSERKPCAATIPHKAQQRALPPQPIVITLQPIPQ